MLHHRYDPFVLECEAFKKNRLLSLRLSLNLPFPPPLSAL